MQGGGGGSFGVLTSYRFYLHPFQANFTLHGNETAKYHALEQVLTQHATYQPG